MVVGDYADHFWGERHIGYHALYENLKRNENAVEELNLFIKEHVNFHDVLLKHLGRSVNRVNTFISENGAFVDSWRLTKGTFELWVEIQTTLVKNLSDLSKEVVKFHDDQVKARKRIRDQDTIDAVNLMQTTTTCLQKAKETYQQRCNEISSLGSENVSGKDFVKAKNKLLKAHEEYRTYVEKYASVRDNFEEKMVKAATAFQTHDAAFLQQFKVFLCTLARHLNESQNAIFQVTGDYQQSLERIDIDQIMLRFTEERGTGTDRPQIIRWSESDEMPMEFESHVSGSAPSSSNSSAVVAGPLPENVTPTVNDLLSINSAWGVDVNSLKSPTDSDSENGQNTSNTNFSSSYVPPQLSSWLGRQKLGQWRKKHASQSNLSTTPTETIGDFSQSYNESKGGFLRRYRKSKNSGSETPSDNNKSVGNKNDVHGSNTQIGLDDQSIGGKSEESKFEIDSEGFTIRKPTMDADLPRKWSSGSSSDEDDETEFQTSKIKSLQIKPLNQSKIQPETSVEEIKNALGHMSLRRSSTLDKDPWCSTTGTVGAPFSQSLNTTTLTKPLRSAFTGDDSVNRKFSEFDYLSATSPGLNLDFSQSTGATLFAGSNIARARPRSHTPNSQTVSSINLSNSTNLFRRKDSFAAEDSTPFGVSTNSLGSLMNLTGWSGDSTASNSASPLFFNESTVGSINRVKIPVAMGINEYVNAWFKDSEKTVVRVFGTVMISFPSSFASQLTDQREAREALKFSLKNANQLKTIQPNSRLITSNTQSPLPQETLSFTIQKQALANFIFEQQQSKPNSDFFNVDLLRYELSDSFEAPLFVHSYWKTEESQTDLRIDYTLNTSENTLTSPLINVLFKVVVDGGVESFNSDPEAKWVSDSQTLIFSLTELTRHGGSTGSLKARLKLTNGPSKPAQTTVQFQTSNTTASNVGLQLDSDVAYQLSLVRRKVVAGKYLSDPEIRS
ncbi:FCH domain only protein 2 [Aphelenchoides besseyi]|nr:FCH domain only protein 2 [Aphelenchoides besseyi]